MRGRVYHPDSPALAALRARGFLGLEHRPSGGVWVPDRKVYSPPASWSWELPPPVRRRAPLLGTVTQDATSGVYVPQSSSEWTSLNSPNIPTPDALWLFQEASGNFADSIGSFTLTAGGTISYAQSVTGWSTKGWKTTDGTTGNGLSQSASLADLRTADSTFLIYGILNATPSANRDLIEAGGAVEFRLRINSTPRAVAVDTSNTATGSNSPASVVWPYALAIGNTVSKCQGYTLKDKLAPTYAAGTSSSKAVRIGGSSGGANPPNFTFMYGVMWKSYIAEVDMASLLDNLLWSSRTWTTAFTGGVSETVSESESLGVVYSAVPTPSETVTLSESVASQAAFTTSASETVTESESADASMGIAYGVSETVSLSETLASMFAATDSVSESVSLTEALAAAQSIALALSESVSLTESLTALLGVVAALAEDLTEDEALADGPMQANVSPSESMSLTEALASLYAAVPALAESVTLTETLTALVPFVIGLSEGVTLTEALAGVFGIVASVSESVALSEALAARLGAVATLTEDLALTEALAVLKASVVGLSEGVTLSEALAAALHAVVHASEVLTETEVLQLIELFYIATLEALDPYIAAETKRVLDQED